jgi:hypothetical protein
MYNFKRIPSVFFTYDIWRAGSLMELGIKHREWAIKENRVLIKRMAVGFTEGERLHFRRKPGQIAVMFFVEDRHFWTHITRKEFDIVFNNT